MVLWVCAAEPHLRCSGAGVKAWGLGLCPFESWQVARLLFKPTCRQ